MEWRRDRRFGKRYILRNIVLSVVPAVALLVLFTRRETDATTWLIAGLFLLWIAGWVLADVMRLRRYRCPSCGTPIRSPTIARRQAGDPIIYFCRNCNIEGDTRFRESTN